MLGNIQLRIMVRTIATSAAKGEIFSYEVLFTYGLTTKQLSDRSLFRIRYFGHFPSMNYTKLILLTHMIKHIEK